MYYVQLIPSPLFLAVSSSTWEERTDEEERRTVSDPVFALNSAP